MARSVWIGSAIYALVYFLLGWDRYATYHSGADLGLFTQTIASTLDGFRNTQEHGNHFIFHFSPILYLCAPFVLLAHSALALVAIQAAACALVAPALYALAARRTNERAAFAIAAIAWVYPPLAGVTFTEFHENGFVAALTVWLLWAIDVRRLGLAALFGALLLATKEDQGLFLIVVGIGMAVYFARRGDPARTWFGTGLACVALAVFIFYFAVVRRLAGAPGVWVPLHFYALGGQTPHGPTTPLFSFGRLTYLLEAFGPLLFVPLFSPLVLASVPGFAECLLSRESLTYTMGQHYAAVWIGYVLVAYAFGSLRFGAWSRRWALVVCLLVLAVASPTHWGHFLRLPNRHDAVLNRFVADIPRDATIGTYDEVYAHLGFVPGAQIGLDPLPQLALFDYTYRSTNWDVRLRPRFEQLLASGTYRVVRREDGVVLAARIRQ